jgi:olefin beta-lactone synthetase
MLNTPVQDYGDGAPAMPTLAPLPVAAGRAGTPLAPLPVATGRGWGRGPIAALLCAQAAARPQVPAIVDTWRSRPRVTTYAELDRASAQAAALLQSSGLRAGDVVLVLQPMSLELYVALIAIFRLGLVPLFVDPSAGRDHVGQCCQAVRPRAFIGSAKAHALRALVPALGRIPRRFVIGPPLPGAIRWAHAARLEPYDTIAECGPADPALITCTSGSTGRPKVAVRSHGFLLAQYRALADNFGGAPGEVSLATMPIFVLADLASGGTSVIAPGDLRHPGRIEAGPVVARIARFRPVRAAGSPAFWERIVRYCDNQRITLPHIQHLYVGGAPVFPRLLTDLHRVAPEAGIVAVYGSTEAEPIAHIAYADLRAGDVPAMLAGRGLLAGRPVPQIALRILRDRWGAPIGPYTAAELEDESLPAGEPGEIMVSGDHVLRGYLGGCGDHETKLRVGTTVWHRTGDAGYLDMDGRLWLLGRCAARISDWRGTLYPFAAECAASARPDVRRAALLARGERRMLVVEPAGCQLTPDVTEIERAMPWAELDAIVPVRRIPVDRRHNAKVDYPALARMMGSGASEAERACRR